MTVRELIAELQKVNQDVEVLIMNPQQDTFIIEEVRNTDMMGYEMEFSVVLEVDKLF